MAAFLLAVIPDGMMIFYNGSEAPEGWEVVEDFAGRFPRACEPPGDTGGSEYHTHEVPDSVPINISYCTLFWWNQYEISYSATVCREYKARITEFDSASNIPPFRYLLVIRKVGEGEYLPKGSVLFFEDSVPAGWEKILIDSFPRGALPQDVGKTGGSYYHTHRYRLRSSPPIAEYVKGVSEPLLLTSLWPDGLYYCDSAENLPPYATLYIAELQNDSALLPTGAIAMFDEEPSGNPWTIPATNLTGRFVMGTASSPGQIGGSLRHTHVCDSGFYNEGGDAACRFQDSCYGEEGHQFPVALYSHISWSFSTESAEALPPYRCVLFRKYLGTPSFSTRKEVFYAPGKLIVRGYQGSTLKLYSADGKLRLSVRITEEKEEVSVKGLPSGVYFAKVGLELYKFPLP